MLRVFIMFQSMHTADTLIVLDFETTGLSPHQGDRAIELGAVVLEEGCITKRFQKLMNPGFKVNSFISHYTGITNKMLSAAPPVEEVIEEFIRFAAGYSLVAHNAAFDKRVLMAEYERIGYAELPIFMCSMLAARRIYPDAPNHKLATLVKYAQVPLVGDFHRALADAEMTAGLWNAMLETLRSTYGIDPVPTSLMMQLIKKNRKSIHSFLTTKNSSEK